MSETESSGPDIVLRAQGLTKTFKGFSAVDGVDLQVRRGSIHALIGPNGAGKTTCFNMLSKFLDPSSGSIVYDGIDITKLPPSEVARMGLVRSFQISAVFSNLTALENVRIALQCKRGNSFDFWKSWRSLAALDVEATHLLHSVGLADLADCTAAKLSYGRKRALELATTMALDPKVLLLDEPLAGMSHEDIDRMVALIKAMVIGRTIVMVEHNLSVVAALSDRITVLARGRVLAEGSYDEVSRDPRVIEAYIGGYKHV